MKLSKFSLFYNTPLVNFQDSMHFSSNEIRDGFFFNSSRYNRKDFGDNNFVFNFIKEKSSIKLPIPYLACHGVNYCSFESQFDNRRYYAYVIGYTRLNDKVTQFDFIIDGVMSLCQGNFLMGLSNLFITRQHLSKVDYESRLPLLKTNDDILKTTTKKYIKQDLIANERYYVLFRSSSDLRVDFGKKDDPNMDTSKGNKVDNITSPQDLYLCEYGKFNDLMKLLSPYPWISKNITKVILLPENFFDIGSTERVDMSKFPDFNDLFTFKDNTKSINYTIETIYYSMDDLMKIHGLNTQQDRHLLRNEYTTNEVYSWNGQQMLLDSSQLSEDTGIKFHVVTVIGYDNQIVFFPLNYGSSPSEEDITNSDGDIRMWKGTFLNNAIIFKDFDEVPVLIDNATLSQANSANQRALAESKLITNQVETAFNPSANLEDRFYSASSILSNVSPTALMGRLTDEYSFYRQQKAQFADLALSSPTITGQSISNGLAIANNYYGITIKIASPVESEWNKIKKYYKLFGYEYNENGSSLSDINSMTVCNYVQFKGSWKIDNIHPAINEMLRVQFENGVRLWHNDSYMDNPMTQNPLSNMMKG